MLVQIDSRKVQEARSRALLSREQLAVKAGVSASRIQKLEAEGSSQRPMKVATAGKICKALGLSPEELVMEVVQPARTPPARVPEESKVAT